MAQGDGDDGDTIPYTQGDSEDEQFNTAIDDTSNDLMIVMGKLLIYHRHIEHFFAFFAGNNVFSLVSESPC